MINHAQRNEQSIFYWALILSLLINCGALIYLLILQHFQVEKISLVPHQATVIMQDELPKQAARWAQTYARPSTSDHPEYEENTQELTATHKDCEPEVVQNAHTETEVLHNTPAQSSWPEKTLQNVTTITPANVMPSMYTDQYMAKSQQKQKPKNLAEQQLPPVKQKITAADIAKGFLHNARKQGTRAISMAGDPGAQMTQEQLRQERYLQKMYHTIDTTFKIYRHQMPHIGMQQLSVRVELALNKDGSIRWLEISEGCGIHSIDLFILEIFKKASLSFAPVPDYLPHAPYTISLSLGICPAKFTPINLRR